MTSDEARQCVALLIASFPRGAPNELGQELFASAIADLDGTQAMVAYRVMVKTREKPFTPSVAEFRRAVLSVANPDLHMPPELAWAEVIRAVGRFGAHRKPSFPPITELAIAAIGWGEICSCQYSQLAVIRAQFREAYRAAQESSYREEASHDAQKQLSEGTDSYTPEALPQSSETGAKDD